MNEFDEIIETIKIKDNTLISEIFKKSEFTDIIHYDLISIIADKNIKSLLAIVYNPDREFQYYEHIELPAHLRIKLDLMIDIITEKGTATYFRSNKYAFAVFFLKHNLFNRMTNLLLSEIEIGFDDMKNLIEHEKFNSDVSKLQNILDDGLQLLENYDNKKNLTDDYPNFVNVDNGKYKITSLNGFMIGYAINELCFDDNENARKQKIKTLISKIKDKLITKKKWNNIQKDTLDFDFGINEATHKDNIHYKELKLFIEKLNKN